MDRKKSRTSRLPGRTLDDVHKHMLIFNVEIHNETGTCFLAHSMFYTVGRFVKNSQTHAIDSSALQKDNTANPGYNEPFCTVANGSLYPWTRYEGHNFT